MKKQKFCVMLSLLFSICSSHAAINLSLANDKDYGHSRLASVMTDKGRINALVPQNFACAEQMQLLVKADYEIKDPQAYGHFQDNLQDLVFKTVESLKKICTNKKHAEPSTLWLSRITGIDKSGRIEGAVQRLGNVTAREQWITKYTQKKNRKEARDTQQTRNAQIAKVRQYNHRQALNAAIYRPKFEKEGPFNGLPGQRYLNAIYHGDLKLVRQADKDYAASLIKLYLLATNNNPGALGNVIAQAFLSINIHDSISAKYLFQYEKQFSACLRNDAEIFGVEEKVPGIVASNMLGIELWRTNGFSNIYTYKINTEFAPVFRQVGTMKPEAMALINFFLNSGQPDYRLQVVKGVQQILQNFECDDPVIKQFEANLQALYK